MCSVFEITLSCYYAHCRKRRCPDVKRLVLRSRVNELFTQSRSAASSRSIIFMMHEDGITIGSFKVRKLMSEVKLISQQPCSHKPPVERPDIPNVLGRAFTVPAPNGVWCGDITYVWAQGRRHYLAAVIDLFAHRVVGWALSSKPDADLVIKALDMAYEQRGRPQNVLCHSEQGCQYGSRSKSPQESLEETANTKTYTIINMRQT